jgi:nitroreductase/NAD-dependent dihydropyrimidine dehydrogenase PreA subunit
MSLLTVDEEKCKRDGICVSECPARVIQMASLEECPEPVSDAEEYCLACGHCVSVCPHGALSLNWLTPDDCSPLHSEISLTPDQAEQFLRSRRSIRTFRGRPVEREKLEKLLEIACYAPSAKNRQPWHWLVVEDTEEVRRLAGMVVDWMKGIIEMDRELGETLGLVRVVESWERGDERVCRGAPHVIIVHGDKDWAFGSEDGALALDYLSLFAPTLGLGTCWGGFFYTAVNQHPPLFERLDLPADHRALGAMMVGYPKFSYKRLPRRNPPRLRWM